MMVYLVQLLTQKQLLQRTTRKGKSATTESAKKKNKWEEEKYWEKWTWIHNFEWKWREQLIYQMRRCANCVFTSRQYWRDADTKLRNELDLVGQSIEQIGEVSGNIEIKTSRRVTELKKQLIKAWKRQKFAYTVTKNQKGKRSYYFSQSWPTILQWENKFILGECREIGNSLQLEKCDRK